MEARKEIRKKQIEDRAKREKERSEKEKVIILSKYSENIILNFNRKKERDERPKRRRSAKPRRKRKRMPSLPCL